MMRLAEYESDDLIEYLNQFNSESGIFELYNLHQEEIDQIYLSAMERKKKQPVPPDIIVRCKDHENVNLQISFYIYRTLLKPECYKGEDIQI